ncbi:hypothetical protein WR25_03914, partial [Diploscapter pachys]
MLILVICLFYSVQSEAEKSHNWRITWPAPSSSIQKRFERAAATTDNGVCSKIAGDILKKGGNAVDASIAGMFCLGVVNPQSSGLGGGFLMTFYNRTAGKCFAIDAREAAPGKAYRDMFVGDSDGSKYGFKAAGVPGELAGYWMMYTRFGSGRVPWKTLVEPAINLARNGHPVSEYLDSVMKVKERHFRLFPSVKHWINPQTNATYRAGDNLKREKLADTLELIANSRDPHKLFYFDWAKTFAEEFRQGGGIMTEQDFNNYKVRVYDDDVLQHKDFRTGLTMCGGPPPSAFSVLQLIISTMSELYPEGHKANLYKDPSIYHHQIEAMKFAYAQRTLLGDHDYVPGAMNLARNLTTAKYTKWVVDRIRDKAQPSEYYGGIEQGQVPDHGTSHISVVDEYGNGVSATTTINR